MSKPRPRKSRTWNKKFTNVKMACWNPWGLGNKRFNYCLALNYEVLSGPDWAPQCTEQEIIWQCKRWISSEDAPIDEEGNIKDSASGVGILLPKRFSELILARGAIGSRIVWVRLKGTVCPLFIVCVYIPHKFRKEKPFTSDILTHLDKLFADCIGIF